MRRAISETHICHRYISSSVVGVCVLSANVKYPGEIDSQRNHCSTAIPQCCLFNIIKLYTKGHEKWEQQPSMTA